MCGLDDALIGIEIGSDRIGSDRVPRATTVKESVFQIKRCKSLPIPDFSRGVPRVLNAGQGQPLATLR